MRLDRKDRMILKALLADGRKSFRTLARETGLTTPTVSARFKRMKQAGVIRKFVPVLDPAVISRGISAIVTLRVGQAGAAESAERLSKLKEVSNVCLTTDENNITLRATSPDAESLRDLVRSRIPQVAGGEVVSSAAIMSVTKGELPVEIKKGVSFTMKCEYCKGTVAGRAFNIRVGPSRYYFCCRTCRSEYLKENTERLARYRESGRGERSRKSQP